MIEQRTTVNGAAGGSQRTTSDTPVGLRWHNGVLEYARRWSDGVNGGIEWVTVPAVNDAAGADGPRGDQQ